MKLTFLGAAGTVTGSCYLIETENKKFLVDCGMFQGIGLEERNNDEFLFDPREIDFVLLTHAHMDHSGLLPKLVKHGFKGDIYLTPPTAALGEILLLDAAKIQENKFKEYSESMPYKSVTSLYDTLDSINTIAMFSSISFGEVKNIDNEIKFKFVKAGHILGAASIVIKVEDKVLVFSGDLGRVDQSIIERYEHINLEGFGKADYVIMESLYGGETHAHRDESIAKFTDVITRTLDSNGSVMIPCFSVHRTQELLEILKEAYTQGVIRDNVQTFLDSPLALRATRVYEQFSTYFNTSTEILGKEVVYDETIQANKDNARYVPQNNRFYFENLKIINRYKQSLRASKKNNSIFIAGSGMADGGRILNHFSAGIENPRNTVLFVGFQAEGTLGRKIVDGAKNININKRNLEVKANIEIIRGFSAHGDTHALLDWLSSISLNDNAQIFLVHAEPDRSEAFDKILREDGYHSHIAEWKSTQEI